MNKKINIIAENQYVHANPWESMSITTDGTADNLRVKILKYYSLGTKTVCMLAGETVPPDQIKLAHILPRSTKAHIFRKLGMESSDINDIRNLLLLSKNVEEAFDSMKISFVARVNSEFRKELIMHVWDNSVLEKPIYPGSTRNIGEFIDQPLNLQMNADQVHMPFKRCLSFQAFMCHWKWSKEGRTGLIEPEDFDDSVYDNNANIKAGREEFKQAFLSDMRDEVEEGDEDDSD